MTTDARLIPGLDPMPKEHDFLEALSFCKGSGMPSDQAEPLARSLAYRDAARRVAAYRAGIAWARKCECIHCDNGEGFDGGGFLYHAVDDGVPCTASNICNALNAHDAAMREAQGENDVIDV